MSDYKFNMPWAPSVNQWKSPFRNRMILTKRGREYRVLAIKYMQMYQLDKERLTERLSVKLTLEPPTKRKYDIDNFCKSLFDALTHAGFWEDDELVDRLTIIKGEKRKGGNILVEVTKL